MKKINRLCVLGLGYIGLPTAVMFAKNGLEVHGVDVNNRVIEMLKNRELHIEEPGLEEMLNDVMDRGLLTVGIQPQKADAFIIAVPTPINKDKSANLEYIKKAAEMILPYLEENALVVLESTVPPRTVEDVLVPILQKTGLKIGEQLFVAHSPERVLPGNLFEELINNDRIVGGVNEYSGILTAELYKIFVKGKIHITDATTAEMVKLMENTYRDVNIALANEFAKIAERLGFDVWNAIELANNHPRVNIHYPGPGVGGHCIAVDPWFIYEKAPDEAHLIHTSRIINDNIPNYVVKKVKNLISGIKKPKIAVLGLAFKGNIDDVRESPSLKIIDELIKFANVVAFDPHVKKKYIWKAETFEDTIIDADLLLILTDHREFKDINIKIAMKYMRNKYVIDTRNVIDKKKWSINGFYVCSLGSCNK